MSYSGYIPLMDSYVGQFDCPTILEIGVDLGQTSLPLIANLVQAKGKNFKYVGIDINLKNNIELQVASINNVRVGNMYPGDEDWNVAFLKSDSLEMLPVLCEAETKFDLILLDGDHNYYTVLNDLKNIENLMHDGSMVIVDDYLGRHSETDTFYSDYEGYENIEFQTSKIPNKQGVKAAVDDWHASAPRRLHLINGKLSDPAIILNNDFVKISRDVAGVKFAHDVKWKVEIADECKNLNNIPFVMHGEITEGAGIYYMVNNIKILGWDGIKKNFGY
jgi:predicted O-methyltransferase YrrM